MYFPSMTKYEAAGMISLCDIVNKFPHSVGHSCVKHYWSELLTFSFTQMLSILIEQ